MRDYRAGSYGGMPCRGAVRSAARNLGLWWAWQGLGMSAERQMTGADWEEKRLGAWDGGLATGSERPRT